MTGEEARRRLLAALHQEARRRWGRLGRIEDRLGRSSGYLGRIARGSWSPSLDAFLETLDALDLEPAAFFGQALDVGGDPRHFLRPLAAGRPPRAHARLEKAVEGLAATVAATPDDDAAAPPDAPGPRLDPPTAAWLASLAALPSTEERRRLRRGRRLQRPEVAAAYLDSLDERREESPREVAGLAATVAAELAPRLAAPPRQRLALACRALGVQASASRLADDLPAAARTLGLALEHARRHDLPTVTAELLERGAYVLADAGLFQRAEALLRDALVLAFDGGEPADLGRILVDRGVVLRYAGRPRAAIRILERAQALLPSAGAGVARNREAIVHHLAQARLTLDDLAGTERVLREAAARGGLGDRERGRLDWQRGRLLARRGETPAAGHAFAAAADRFARAGSAAARNDEALLSVDWARLLAAAGRPLDARRLVRGRAPVLLAYRGRRSTAEVLARLVREADDLDGPRLETLASLLRLRPGQRAPPPSAGAPVLG